MLPSELVISRIGRESDILLRNLFEHYCHDMSEWLDFDTRDDGSYRYDTTSVWTQGSKAYLARIGHSIAGFALIRSGSEWLGDIGAHDVQEFFVMRRFRRRGIGKRMATLVWNEHPGEWLVRVLEVNAPAIVFWKAAISDFSMGSYQESQRVIDKRSWKFFRFVSDGVR